MKNILSDINSFLEKYIFLRGDSSEEDREYLVHASENSINVIQAIFLSIIFLGLISLPFDLIRQYENPHFYNLVVSWRITILVPMIIIVLLRRFINIQPALLLKLIVAACLLMCFSWANTVSEIGGFETVYFFPAYLFPMITVFMEFRILARIISSYLVSLSCLFGYLIYHPEYTSHPAMMNILVVYFVATAFSVVFGHTYFYLNRKNYLINLELDIEKQKSENLLTNMLPASIADRLKGGEASVAEGFHSVSVLFADIAGFTPISENSEPHKIVSMLNEIFSRFDELTDKADLEKIKTIGDAYMVAGGIPNISDDHAEKIADLALAMQKEVAKFKTPDGEPLSIRIGINSGPVVAGVIGIKKFVYDLWGDTVNTASRLESHGEKGRIQVTESTYELLKGKYEFEERGEIDIKGKGKVKTWWLLGKKVN